MRLFDSFPLLASLALLPACAADPAAEPAGDPPYVPPPESCDSPSLDEPRVFVPCNIGSGIFGTWVLDERGLPAYEYGLDQNADPRARFFNTEGIDRREHWAAFGNGRVNALFYNDGYIEVTLQDRGESYLNKLDADQGNYAGGFSYLDDGTETWPTAYKWRPKGSKTRRRFGMGYAEASTEYRGIRLVRKSFAPKGDAPLVVDEVAIENLSGEQRTLRHYEFWDVARRPIEIRWLVSGMPFTSAPSSARADRDGRNALFQEKVEWDPQARAVHLRRTHAAGVSPPPPGQPDPVDYYPGDPFLVALTGGVADVYAEQASFFGGGGVKKPDAVANRTPGHGMAGGEIVAEANGLGQGRMFALRTDVSLSAGERTVLRFAYGVTPMGAPVTVDPALSDPSRDLLSELQDDVAPHLFYFAPDRDPVLHRELAWHASQLEVSVGVREYWGVHVVPQGSAYLYLHGADGAARDLSLFAVPLVYTHPSLAKEELMLNMGITHAPDKRISYAFQGHGMLDDAEGLHSKPSDLTLFLLWAVSEYIGATGDTGFLDEPVPYWPREALPAATAWDHVRDAIRHLFDVVGTGDHGLIRVQTGDWSDGIVFAAKDRSLAIDKGESVPNTQMAVAILPGVADLIEPRDAALAAEIRTKVDSLRQAAQAAWTGSFFGRAYFGDGVLYRAGTLDLEAQVWALIGDTFAAAADRSTLVGRIAQDLDNPSPAGAMLVAQGQVWPAISGLLTWGYARSDTDRAFTHLARNTMAAHAVAYPEGWAGIWSGPDGLNGPSGDRPGQAWYSQVTPMADFPVMNNNQHAMPILAALRAAGIEATATGVRLSPPSGRSFSLRAELVDLTLREAKLTGAYRPIGGGSRTIDVLAPAGQTITGAMLNGAAVTVPPAASSIQLTVTVPSPGAESTFEVTLGP